ncbi:MAG: ion transporter [Eubacterium sp.]|nr:ion transporter [Eubacterium sp.]
MNKKQNRKRIFEIIQIGQRSDMISRLFDYFIVGVILVNIAVLFLETFDELSAYRPVFRVLGWITVGIFVVEYALRIYTADFLYPEVPKGKAVWKFLISFDGMIMLLTILPFFYLSGFGVLRMLRVVRIFHLFRINNSYDSFHVITSVLVEKKNQIFSSVFIIIVLMLSSSLCMYSVEHTRQPEAFSNALSGVWWSMSTIFTVGYGDIYPVTMLGRVMAMIITFLGVGAVAIPTGIISAGFVEHYTRMQTDGTMELGKKQKLSISVDKDSPFLNATVKEVEERFHIVVVVIIRAENILLPSNSQKIEEEDIVVYTPE